MDNSNLLYAFFTALAIIFLGRLYFTILGWFIVILLFGLFIMWLFRRPAVRVPVIHRENLENCPTPLNPACDANMINNLKNQINVMELKVENLQKQITTNTAQAQSNQKEIDKFNTYITQLQAEITKGIGK